MTTQRFWREFALILFLRKKRNISFFWTKKVARESAKWANVRLLGKKKMVFISFSFWTVAFFFINFKWASMMQMRSIYFRSTPTWRNVVTGYPRYNAHSPVPWANQYKKRSLNWISCENQWSFVGTEASQNPYQYVYTSICTMYVYIYILDTVAVNWFSYRWVSIYLLLSYGIFIHFIIWG